MFANDVKDVFGNVFSRGGQIKIINLPKKVNVMAFESGFVDAFIMSCRLEAKIRESKDAIDMFFPESATFWMALECLMTESTIFRLSLTS